MQTLSAAFAEAAGSTAGVRFVDKDEQATFYAYGDLYARARATAVGLHAQGVRPGDVVAIIMATCPEFYDTFLGAILLGAVPVALYPPMRLGRMQDYHAHTAACLRRVRAAIVVTDARIRRLLGETVQGAQPRLGCQLPEQLDAADFVPASAHEADLAFLQFSSGTTSAPKPIGLTHGQVLANIRAIAARIYRDAPLPPGVAQHTAVSWLPLYHDMGLVGAMLTALCDRTTVTLIGPELFVARPAIWLRTLSRYRATVSAAPNFAYSLCAQRVRPEQLAGVDLSAWQVALNGAETVSPKTLRSFAEAFAPWGFRPQSMTPVYGLAEAALAVTFGSPGAKPRVLHVDADKLERAGIAEPVAAGLAVVSLGTPLDAYAVRIVDAAGAPVPMGHRGHIQARGPSIAAPHAGAADAHALPTAPGWLATGDVGFDWQGELFVVGRHKDLVIVRGRNIAPQLIEESLDAVPGVRMGCVVAASHRPENQDTDSLVLLVERSATRPNTAEPQAADQELVALIRRSVVSRCQISPDQVVLLAPGTLPRTSSGKLRRGAALAAHLRGRLTPPKKVTWWRLVTAMVRSAWAMGRARRRASP